MSDCSIWRPARRDEKASQECPGAPDPGFTMDSDRMTQGLLRCDECEKLLKLVCGGSRAISHRQEEERETRRRIHALGGRHVQKADDGANSRAPEGGKFVGKRVDAGIGSVIALRVDERHGHTRKHTGNSPPEVERGE